MKHLDRTSSRQMRWLGAALLIATLIALPVAAQALGSNSTITLATRILIMGIAAASLNFALGYGGMISFGHAAFFGIGAYTVTIFAFHASTGDLIFGLFPSPNALLITVPLAMITAGLAACLIGAISLRTKGVQFIMITLAFAQMLFFFFSSLSYYGGDDGLIIRRPNTLFGLNLRDRMTMYYVALVFAAGFFVVYSRLIRSSFGIILNGFRQNEERMGAIGLSSYRYHLIAFTLSGMGAGLAGALMANLLRFSSPDMLSWNMSGELMIMVILGGVASVRGPFLGAAALLLLEDALSSRTEHWPLFLGLLLLTFVLFARGGIISFLKVFWEKAT